MIEKDAGCPRIHQLHSMAILESDFNQAVRIIIAQQLGFKMEDNKLVPDMQYASQKDCQCISAVLNKQLMHDIKRHQKAAAAFIENDTVVQAGILTTTKHSPMVKY
jgi:squalene cyclase